MEIEIKNSTPEYWALFGLCLTISIVFFHIVIKLAISTI